MPFSPTPDPARACRVAEAIAAHHVIGSAEHRYTTQVTEAVAAHLGGTATSGGWVDLTISAPPATNATSPTDAADPAP